MSERPLVVKDTVQEILAEPGITTYDPADDPIVRARGLKEPGDGGGGDFRVTASGAETDGGTCFVFDGDESQEVTESIQEPTWNQVSLSNSDLVWGSFSARYGSATEDEIPVDHLHGHNTKTQGTSNSHVDFKNGTFGPTGAAIKNLTDLGYGDDTWEYTYRYATASRRLERVSDNQSVNLAWWGAPTADPDNPQSADPLLKWAINAAAQKYQTFSYPWAYVDIPGEYYYLHATHLRNGVQLRGTGSTLSQTWNTKGALRLMPGEAIYYRKTGYDETAPENRDRYHMALEERQRQVLINEYNASKIGIQNLLIDGNLPNQTVFQNLGDYNSPESHLQNSGTWSGFYSTGKDGQSFPDGMVVALTDVDFQGMGANGFGLGSGDADFQTSNVNANDAVRNHILYAPTGDGLDDITAQGQCWGAFAIVGDSRTSGRENWTNLTLENLEEGEFYWEVILADRDGSPVVDGFTVDLRTLPKTFRNKATIIKTDGHGKTFKNGTVEGLKPENISTSIEYSLFEVRNKSDFTQLTTIRDVTVNDYGQHPNFHPGQEHINNVEFINVDFVLQSGVDAAAPEMSCIDFGLGDPASALPRAERVYYKNCTFPIEYQKRGIFSYSDKRVSTGEAHPHDLYWTGGEIAAKPEFDKFVNEPGGYDNTIRCFLEDVTLYVRSGGGWHSDLRPGNTARLRNCDGYSGRTSDAVSQSYTATADDESNGYALIPTNLMSRAWETSVSAGAGYNVTGVEIANSDGTLRADDDTNQQDPYLKVSVDGSITQGDTFTWTARVTPTVEYQTTGLFTARKKSDESYTSGNGPFTVDLRGVASSQESREKVVYTASSSNTSVVTASVQGDDYTLELTEQGTGTATITVTGEIPGVGTASTTFDVTIS